MSGKNASQDAYESDRRDAREKQTPRSAKRKKRRGRRLLLLLALLIALVWFLPGIVANSPALEWVVAKAAADLNGTVSIQSASIGWLSPVAFNGVEVKDADGRTVFSAASVGSERSPVAMLQDSGHLGRFYVFGPKISLVMRDDGSNVEDMLSKYLAPSEDADTKAAGSATNVGFSLQIDRASVVVADERSGLEWQVKDLSLNVDMPKGPAGPIAARMSAALPNVERPGKIDVEAQIDGAAGQAAMTVANLPLGMFRALAARLAPGTTLDGLLSSSIQASWNADSPGGNRLTADVNVESLSATAPRFGNDRLALDRLHAVGDAAWSPEQVEVAKLSVDCDVGSVLFSGVIPLDEGAADIDLLISRRQELDGRLDLARLARLLPDTLRLRQGVRIDSGQVRLTAAGKPTSQGMAWDGQLHVADLAASAGGRQIVWRRPVSAILQAHEDPNGPVIDSLRCESDFLKLHAAGSTDRLTASLTFSLDRLAAQLDQFVDMADFRPAGEGTGSLNWTRNPQDQFTASAELQINDFRLAAVGKPTWIEKQLSLSFSTAGRTDFSDGTRIDATSLELRAGGDRIAASLSGPVVDMADGGAWPVRLDMRGQLRNWPARLAAWLPVEGWRVFGDYDLNADLTASAAGVELRSMKLTVVPLQVTSKSFNANEPRLGATVVGFWDTGQRQLQIHRAGMDCGTLAADAENVIVALPESGDMELTGAFKYQAFVGRLREWFADPTEAMSWRLTGQLRGSAQLRRTAGTIGGTTDAELHNLAVIDSSGQRFEEPLIKLSAAGDFDPRSKVVQLSKCEIASSMLAAGATGQVAPIGEQYEAQIDGSMRYDMERIVGLARPYVGKDVQVVGRGQSPFWYRGPLSPAAGRAAAGLKWDRANVYGLQIGPGELKAAMANGAVKIEPMQLTVGQGRMYLAPNVRLSPGSAELTMPAGPLMENVQIDPAVCSSLLKYIAPVLADVTSAQGSFSIVLDSCRAPLADLKKSDLSGRFIVHSIQIGPGPLIRELAVLLGRETPAKLRKESTVAFRMKDGRVYHRNLELIFPDLTIRTEGSVGLDQTLDIVAEMPVPPKWLANDATAARAFADQVIRIPLKGTLSKPQLDRRELERLSRQFIQKAAGNLLEEQLNKQLDQLFKPRGR